jgi:hypothetical protein
MDTRAANGIAACLRAIAVAQVKIELAKQWLEQNPGMVHCGIMEQEQAIERAEASMAEWFRQPMAAPQWDRMPMCPRQLKGGWLEARELLAEKKRSVAEGVEFEAAAAVCKTDRIGHDPVDYYVLLPMRMEAGRLIVRTPRKPVGGVNPGVYLGDGVPILARREMKP